MTDREAFIRAIVADPAEDTRRLVFADWLDENGSPADRLRAGFIRRQCDRHSVHAAPSVPLSVLVELEPYLDGHLQPHQYEFNVSRRGEAEVRYWLDRYRLQWAFFYRRGFVDEVRCPLVAWLEHGPGLVRRHPVMKVVVMDREPGEYEIHQGPWLWMAEGDHRPHEPSDLPARILDHLPLYRADEVVAVYDTREDAFAALSAACLAWARSHPGGGSRTPL